MTTPSNTHPVRILVVDDHPNTAAMLARALSQLGPGVQVTSASNGGDALAKVKDNGVDILITDMIMPEMTGLELIEKLQSHPAGRPSFSYLITAYDVPGLKVTAHRLKVNEVIIKPVRPERICEIATQAIEEMKHTTRPPKLNLRPHKKFNVLVADDQPDNITLLGRYLEFEGYNVLTAADGVEALKVIQDRQPDLVLLDINMPHKDGFVVLEEIRANPFTEHIPVIILTAARLDPADMQSGFNLGADDYVTKPFDRHELMARIRTKLRVKEAEDAIRRRNRELSILPEIGKELSGRTEISPIAETVLKRTCETMGAIDGVMFLTNPQAEIIEQFKAPLNKSEISPEPIEFAKNLIGRIQDTRQGVIIKNMLNDPYWVKRQNEAGRSAMVAPLFGRHAMLGLLVLIHEQENYFTLEQLLLLQAIASQAAIAIENIRLYQSVGDEENQSKKVKSELLAAIAHDLQKPLLEIEECGALLAQAGPLNPQQATVLERLRNSAGQIRQVIEDKFVAAQQ
ncbi:MAG: response regulator [Anaerolineales bacterium]|nr:response regulator [Anaerolineales bacterium]